MRIKIILLVFLFSNTFILGQRYLQSTFDSNYGNYDLKHNSKLIMGDINSMNNERFQIFKNSQNSNMDLMIGNLSGRIQISIAGCNGCFDYSTKPGDGVIRKLGNSHNLFLTMSDDKNDGSSKVSINDNIGAILTAYNNGKVVIGRGVKYDNEGFSLYVGNGIRTERVKVDVASSHGWADYVFEKDYELIKLSDLKNYILKNKHLPEVPTKEEALRDGVELLEFNILLLKKIEELTLYTIQQEERIIKLEEKVKKSNHEN